MYSRKKYPIPCTIKMYFYKSPCPPLGWGKGQHGTYGLGRALMYAFEIMEAFYSLFPVAWHFKAYHHKT